MPFLRRQGSVKKLPLGKCWAAALVIAGVAAASGAAAQHPVDELPLSLLPGIGARDPRERVDPDAVPWRSIGKVQAATATLRNSCTGTIVDSAVVLTAAHCLFNVRTGSVFPPAAIHFVIIGANGWYAAKAGVRRVVIAPGYDRAHSRETLGNDWALMMLDTPVGAPDRILAMADHKPETGANLALGGYSQDHTLLLMADSTCHVVGWFVDATGHPLLHHNCTGTRGVSGAPLLVRESGAWRIVAVDVAAQRGVAGGLAVVLDDARAWLRRP